MKILSERVVRTTKDTVDWQLDQGQGKREHKEHIVFAEPFTKTPVVQVSLAHLDVISSKTDRDGDTHPLNTRFGIDAFDIDETGFDLVFNTWEDTRIAGLGVVWLAYGE